MQDDFHPYGFAVELTLNELVLGPTADQSCSQYMFDERGDDLVDKAMENIGAAFDVDTCRTYMDQKLTALSQDGVGRGRRGALGGAQEQRDADDAVVSCARPTLRRRPCLATSMPDPYLFAAACRTTRSATRAPRRSRRR